MYLEAIKKYIKAAKIARSVGEYFCLGTFYPNEVHIGSEHFSEAVKELKPDMVQVEEEFSEDYDMLYFFTEIDGKQVKIFSLKERSDVED